MKDKPYNRDLKETRMGEIYGDVQGVARIFYLFIGIVLLGLITGIFIVMTTNNFSSAVILASTIPPLVASLYLVRTKRFEIAAAFLGVFLILMNTVLSTKSLGIHSISNFAFPVILIIASLVTNRRIMFSLTFLTVLCIAWLVFGELWGLYTPGILVQSVPGDFLSAAMIVILTAIIIHRITGFMYRSFSQAQREVLERRSAEENLRQREAILNAVMFAAEQFLKTPDWRISIDSVLERLGREFNASHAYLFEKHLGADGVVLNSLRYEWTALGQRSDLDDPDYQNAPAHDTEFSRYYEILNRGDPYIGSSSYFTEDERMKFGQAGIKAILELRIVVDGKQWGTIGFDEMAKEREWTAMEVDVLKVAANILGAAIKRQLDEDALKKELAGREKTERALRLSEEKFSKAFHTAQALMTIEDADGRFVDVNNAFVKTLGYDREEILGRSSTELNLMPFPEDKQKASWHLKEKGLFRDLELRVRKKSGEAATVLMSIEDVHINDMRYVLTSALDITGRKRVEQQIRRHAARAEVLASLSHTLTQVNQDYNLTLEKVVRSCAELIGDGASILAYSPEKEFLELIAVYNSSPEAMQVFREEFESRPIKWNEGAYATAIGEDEPVLIPFIDVDRLMEHASPERRDYYRKLPIHSMMLAPLHVHGKVLGVIGMARHSPGNNYTPEDLTFLQDIADRSALAMLNAQYYEELKQELTERRRLERELQDERDFALQIINSLGQGLTVTDASGHFLLVNPAFAHLIGYEPDELIGVDPITLTHSESQEVLADALRNRRKGIISTYESKLQHKNGDAIPVLITGAPRLKDGKFAGSISSVTDLTEIKWAQDERERLITELSTKNAEAETLRETTSIVTSTLDVSEAVQRILDQLKRVVPYDSASVWLYEDNSARMVGLDGLQDIGEEDMFYVIAETEPDYRFISEDVSYILLDDVQKDYPQFREAPSNYIHGWLSVALKARGRLIGFISLDSRQPGRFTERDANLALNYANQVSIALENARLFSDLQRELDGRKKLIDDLESKNVELEQFTYTVSHDLKSPLVTINGFLGYLEQDAISGNFDRLRKDSQRINEAVQKMQRLLSELLELSRIGRMMNPPEEIPFNELVEEAMSIVQGRLEECGVTVYIQPNLPVIYGDRPRLIEVLQNLMDNAAKYMGNQKSPHIEIGQRGNENDMPVFYVRDNGMGIEAEHHERIFGLFNKLDAKSEGTGVGLALVKRIIEFHGGRIWVESDMGKGSTFLFILPAGKVGGNYPPQLNWG